jgi:small nuclear ribonucleoprotein (snRNP)-like protein
MGREGFAMIQDLVGDIVVVDMRSPFVCIGTLRSVDDHWLELVNADMHDLRDTQSSREIYVADTLKTGVKRNRKRLLLVRADAVAVSRLTDVVDE